MECVSPGGHSRGKVTAKVTATAKVEGHTAKATPANLRYRVKSASGGEAIHKPEALTKAGQ